MVTLSPSLGLMLEVLVLHGMNPRSDEEEFWADFPIRTRNFKLEVEQEQSLNLYQTAFAVSLSEA